MTKHIVLLLLFSAAQKFAIAQDGPTFQGGTALVHLDVAVDAASGKVLSGLQKSDFRVFDNGEEQVVTACLAEQESLELMIVFDTSGSMHRQLEKVNAAAHASFQLLRPGDRISVMVFNTEPNLLLWPTEDLKLVEEQIKQVLRLRFRGGTRIQDAVNYGAEKLLSFGNPDKRRRAVVIITDNRGRPASTKVSAIVDRYWEADASLSGLVVPALGSLAGLLHTPIPGRIDDIVARTGGELIRSEDLGAKFQEMIAKLRARYSLFYRIPPDGVPDSVRTIHVELTSEAQNRYPNTRIAARSGYRVANRDKYGFEHR